MMTLGFVIMSLVLLCTCWLSLQDRHALRETEARLRQAEQQEQERLAHSQLRQDTLETALHLISNTSSLRRCHKRLVYELATLLHYVPATSSLDTPILTPQQNNELTYALGRITTLLKNSSDLDLITLWATRTPRHIHLMIDLILQHTETGLTPSDAPVPLHPLAHCTSAPDPTHTST